MWREQDNTLLCPTAIIQFLILLLVHFQTIEDFILLIGTFVAFVAFILWCCFPVVPTEVNPPPQYDSRNYNQYKKVDTAYEINS
jgi:hypothetical protein